MVGPARWVRFDFRLSEEAADHPSNFSAVLHVVMATTRVLDLQEIVAERYWQLRKHVRLYRSAKVRGRLALPKALIARAHVAVWLSGCPALRNWL